MNEPEKLRSLLPDRVAALQEVVDQFAGGVIHFDVERFHATGQIVEHHDGRDSDEQAHSGGDQSFRNTAGDGSQTGCLRLEMPRNAFKIPTTVPNSPTKGAVEPMVARPPRPRFNSA